MGIEHNIEVINGALLLGDKFVPPAGTTCRITSRGRFTSHKQVLYVEGVWRQRNQVYLVGKLRSRMVHGEWSDGRRTYYFLVAGPVVLKSGWGGGRLWEVQEIIGVSSDAPLFEEWERLK